MVVSYALVIGESLVDVVTDAHDLTVERPGGSAANVAVALARLGRPVRFMTSYADDRWGAMIADHLAGSGVVLATDPHVLSRTSSAAAMIGTDGSATYVFDLDWQLGPIVLEEPPLYVHVCSIGAVLEPGADDVLALLDRLLADTTPPTVTYDINARPAITGAGPEVVGRVEAVCRRAHVVKASDEDVSVLYPDLSLDEVAAHLRTFGPRAVVVTRGERGATWYADDATVDGAAAPTTVVDTIGAGDTFSAAIIDALWNGLDPAATVAHAAEAAGITVSRAGADPPTRADLATP